MGTELIVQRQHSIVTRLLELGIDLHASEHTHYKFNNKPWMPLVVETWKDDSILVVSICHYGEQNGDLMRDPEVVFRLVEPNFQGGAWILQPLSYRNDYVGVEHVARYTTDEGQIMVSPKYTKELISFLRMWARNLKAQGFTKECMIK